MMALLKNLSFIAHLLFCFLSSNKAELHRDVFPDDFAWGCASSAYQIEGAWNLDGKGPSIWDTYTHEGGHVYANQSGDVACDSYHNYKKDVKMLKMLGIRLCFLVTLTKCDSLLRNKYSGSVKSLFTLNVNNRSFENFPLDFTMK